MANDHAATVLLSVGEDETTVTLALDCDVCGHAELRVARRHLALLAHLLTAAVERDMPSRQPLRLRQDGGT